MQCRSRDRMYIHKCIHTHTDVYTYIHTCKHIHTYVCIYIHTYIHRWRLRVPNGICTTEQWRAVAEISSEYDDGSRDDWKPNGCADVTTRQNLQVRNHVYVYTCENIIPQTMHECIHTYTYMHIHNTAYSRCNHKRIHT